MPQLAWNIIALPLMGQSNYIPGQLDQNLRGQNLGINILKLSSVSNEFHKPKAALNIASPEDTF